MHQKNVSASDVDGELEVDHLPGESSHLFDDLLPQDRLKSKANNHFELDTSYTPSMPKEHDRLLRMDLDGMLKKLGQFGKFQVIYFFMLLFPVLLSGFRITEYVFTTMNTPHRCRVPECEGTTGSAQFSPVWLNRAVPLSKDLQPQFCLRYRPWNNTVFNSNCSADLFDSNVTQRCNDWVFSDPVKTIAHDFNIMCPEDFWKLTLLGTFSVLTSFVGLFFVGLISDRLGRKTVMVYAAVFIAITGVIRSFSFNYEMLATLEFIDGLVIGAIYSSAFILGLETLSPSKRLLGSTLIFTFFALGESMLGFFMWLVQDWRILLRVYYIPMLFLVALHWLLPESVRWLYTRGRISDIEIIFSKIAKDNKTEECLSKVITDLRSSKSIDTDMVENGKVVEPVKSLRLKAVMNSRILMRRFFTCALCWIAVIFTFYGIPQNATYISGGNRYATFVLMSLIEVPAHISSRWVPDWPFLGRRGSAASTFFIIGVACLTLNFLSSKHEWINLSLFLISKFASTMTVNVIYVYTAEVFPTEVRHSLHSTCSMVGRIGAILSQQMRLVEVYVDPNVVFGIVSLIGCSLMLTCPETLGTTLPDTIQEAENIGRKKEHRQPPVEQVDDIKH